MDKSKESSHSSSRSSSSKKRSRNDSKSTDSTKSSSRHRSEKHSSSRDKKRSKKDESSSRKKTENEEELEEEVKPTIEPKSFDEIFKKKEQDEKEIKPVFLTKQQRAELAIKNRQNQVNAQKQRMLDEIKEREEFAERQKQLEKEKEKEREKERSRSSRDEQRELAEIKDSYLGIKKQKKRVIKASEKFKFVFDWDASEDTSTENNVLYREKADYRPQFGRGFIGGVDKKEQIKKYRDVMSDKQRSSSRTKKESGDKAQDRNIRKEKDDYEAKIKNLDKFEKSIKHWSEKTRSEMKERDWRIFREDHKISTKGGSIPNPIRSWRESKLPKPVVEAIKDVAKYKKPSAIQMQAIPIALNGRDIIGVAETGSGKTAAFVLPMLVYISKLPPMTMDNAGDGPYALILAPTRELVQQIEEETRKFCTPMGYKVMSIVGGQSIDEQAFTIQKGCEIVIATPGRLQDCLESRYMALNQCNYIVMDEADRMVELNFEASIHVILDAMPTTNLKSEDEEIAAQQEQDIIEGKTVFRTTIMYSATMPAPVERLAKKYLRRPAYVSIGDKEKTVDTIKQTIEIVRSENDKWMRLEGLLSSTQPPIILFVNSKINADNIWKGLQKTGWKVTRLHSGRSQDQRELAITEFKAGKFDILIATDVAGRGIDVKGVQHVINYDMPKTIEFYTHRVGRTGRAGQSGLATSLLNVSEDTDIIYDLNQLLLKTKDFIPQELANSSHAQVKPGSVPDKPMARRDTVIYANTEKKKF